MSDFWAVYKTKQHKDDWYCTLDKRYLVRPYAICKDDGYNPVNIFLESDNPEPEDLIKIENHDLFYTKESAESFYIKELERRILIDQEEIRLAKQRLLK